MCLCRHGGHCGFVGPQGADDDGYWAEKQIVDFMARVAAAPRADAVAVAT
jgi:predicted alpha/beta-fold hydrolase